MGLSSQKWVCQDFSAVGMGRRPRRGKKAREGGEAQILLFSPSSPLLLPPSFLGLPALSLLSHSTTRLKQCSPLGILAQVSWEVSMTSPQTHLPRLVFTLSRSQVDPTERSLPSRALHPAGSAPETFPLPTQWSAAKSKNRDKGV